MRVLCKMTKRQANFEQNGSKKAKWDDDWDNDELDDCFNRISQVLEAVRLCLYKTFVYEPPQILFRTPYSKRATTLLYHTMNLNLPVQYITQHKLVYINKVPPPVIQIKMHWKLKSYKRNTKKKKGRF